MNLNSGVLVIRDRGVGVNPRDLPHVFERFWRSPAARSLPGSGLGLAIVDRAVRQAGGTVELRAASEVGTEAIVRLPGCEVPPPSSKPRASEKILMAGEEMLSGGARLAPPLSKHFDFTYARYMVLLM